MADKKSRTKRPSLTPEEILAKSFRIKCRFRALVRFALANKYWLDDVEDEELGYDVQKNVILLMRKKEKKGKPTNNRTEAEKAHLNRVIGGLKCFRRYPAHVKVRLVGVTFFVYYGPGRVIVRQGDAADSLYFIIAGEIIIRQQIYDPILDKEISQDVGRKGPGAMFGEVSLLHGVPRTATILTATHCEFLRLRKGDFDVVLKATVQEQWNEICRAMNMFSYFRSWDEISIRECCILSKIQDFHMDETILGDGVGFTNHVYFIIKGTCRIIHHLMVVPYVHAGKKLYRLYEPNDEPDIRSYSRTSAFSNVDLANKTVDEHDDDNRETKNIHVSMKIAEKLSTANLPSNVEVHFMQESGDGALGENVDFGGDGNNNVGVGGSALEVVNAGDARRGRGPGEIDGAWSREEITGRLRLLGRAGRDGWT
ncbi:hypothetical protein RN001_004104 [Aquatica leii]|uniref:Cyclic nucleotide-binding domain-containing protein n=1 Tax=Aquatica leii TaxID=1421715 RepID=A0AAN7SRT7_9COLE|nr:hypothetical protein RN001_004104 [Aquatica leii]